MIRQRPVYHRPVQPPPPQFRSVVISPVDGMMRYMTGGSIPMGASPDMSNIYVFEGELRKRQGYEVFKGLPPIGEYITGIYATQDEQNNTHLIATHKTGVAKFNFADDVWEAMTGPALTDSFAPMVFETSQNSIVFSSGRDPVMRHDISTDNLTYAVLSADCPPARYLTRFADRLVLGYTVEGGQQKPFRIRRSAAGDHADWTGLGSGFSDLTESPYHLKGLRKLQEMLGIYTERSVHLGTKTGISAMPYTVDLAAEEQGLLSHRTILPFPGQPGHLYLGHDDVYVFNGTQLQPTSLPVRDQIFGVLNPASTDSNFAFLRLESQEALFFLATEGIYEINVAWVFNYVRKIWYPWIVSGMTCATGIKQDDDVTIDELVGTIDQQGWEFDNRLLSSAFPGLLTGGADGRIYHWRKGVYSDNGVGIPCRWTSRDFEWDDFDPNMAPSRLTLRQLGVTYRGSGADCTLRVSYSADAGDHWDGPFPLLLEAEPGTRTAVLHRQFTGDRIRFKVENDSADETFRILNFHPVFELRETYTP